KRCMLEVANGKLMPRFALSLHYVSGTLNTALNGLLLVTRQIGQFCNIFFGCAVDDATHNRRISTISPGYLIAARACWPRLLPGSCRGLDGCRCLSGNVAGANRSWLFPTTMRYPLGKFDTVHLVLPEFGELGIEQKPYCQL